MEQASKTNKRSSPRAPIKVGIDYSCEGTVGAGITRNISTGGIFVECRTNLEIGSMVDVSFFLPGTEEPLKAMVWVVWEKEGEGFGAQFLNLNAETRDGIEDYVVRTMLRPKGGTAHVLAGSA